MTGVWGCGVPCSLVGRFCGGFVWLRTPRSFRGHLWACGLLFPGASRHAGHELLLVPCTATRPEDFLRRGGVWGPCGCRCVCTQGGASKPGGTLVLDGMCGVLVTWSQHALCSAPPLPHVSGMCAQSVCTCCVRRSHHRHAVIHPLHPSATYVCPSHVMRDRLQASAQPCAALVLVLSRQGCSGSSCLVGPVDHRVGGSGLFYMFL